MSLFCTGVVLTGCTTPFNRQKPAGLQVLTSSLPSSIFLNGQYLDKTPLIDRELPPGEYHIKIEPDDAQLVSYDTTVNLRPGILTVVTWKPAATTEQSGGVIYEMEKLPNANQTELSISTVPESAIIAINGESTLSPVQLEDISPGEQEYQVSLPSYESQQNTITIRPGYKMLVLVKLAKQQSTAEASEVLPAPSSPADASDSAETASVAGVMTELSTPTPTRPQVLILSTGYKQDGKEVLRVRSQPSTTSAQLGFAQVGKTYTYLGEEQRDWIKIEYAGKPGWVKEQFVEVQSVQPE